MASEAEGLADVSTAPVDEELEEEDLDADAEEDIDADADADADADVDPDATAELDDDLDPGADMDTQDDMDPDNELGLLSTTSKSRLTARQAAMITGGSTMNHVMLREYLVTQASTKMIHRCLHSRGHR
jgi:hypothetical protein